MTGYVSLFMKKMTKQLFHPSHVIWVKAPPTFQSDRIDLLLKYNEKNLKKRIQIEHFGASATFFAVSLFFFRFFRYSITF